MYNSYFSFSEAPFEDRLDPRFLFLGEDHREVLAALLFFIKERKGLGIVCGDVGTGKTMLLNTFLSKLPDSVQPIVISNPLIDYQELLLYIASRLGVSRGEDTILGLADRVKEKLVAARNAGQSYALIVDEAHLLSNANLEHIRLFSNFETPEDKLLQILLVGQYELSDRLKQPGLRQLHQRININRFLSPLSATETWQYVEHRLQVVGSGFDRLFEPVCKTLIHQLTEGVPRRINHLCDTALLICMGEGVQQVSGGNLKKAHEALQTDQIFRARYGPSEPAPSPRRKRKTLILLAAAVSLLAFGVVLGSTGFRGGVIPVYQKVGSAVLGGVPAPAPPAAGPESNLAAAPQPAPEAGPSPAKIESPSAEAAAPAPPAAEPEKTALSPSPPPPPQVASKPSDPAPPGSSEAKVTPTALETKAASPEVKPRVTPPAQETKPASPAPHQAGEAVGPTSRIQVSPLRQVEVEDNNTLSHIARLCFPKQPELGMVALLLANPGDIAQEDLSFVNLPEIDPASRTIKVGDGVYYAFVQRFTSSPALEEAISRLTREDVRYAVLNTGPRGGPSYRLVIGAYDTREGLEQALLRVKEQSG